LYKEAAIMIKTKIVIIIDYKKINFYFCKKYDIIFNKFLKKCLLLS